MLKLLSKPWLENDSAALDESIKSLLQFTDDELSELSYGVQNIKPNYVFQNQWDCSTLTVSNKYACFAVVVSA